MKDPKKPAKREPIIVTNPNDKRLRAYNDSNALYQHSDNYRKVLLKNSISPVKNEIVLKNTAVLDKIHKNIPYSKTGNDKIKPIGYYDIGVGNNKQYNESAIYKKPVQPYKLEKKKPAPKPVDKPVAKPVAKPTAKPTAVVKEDKKMYQGRSFMDSTGLRPGNYTPTQIKAAVAKKKLK